MKIEYPEFEKAIRHIILVRLTDYFGDKLSTKEEPLSRNSFAYSFCHVVLNSIGTITDYTFASYKIDDSNEVRYSLEFLYSERHRLINDLNMCDNIVLFLVDKLNIR